MKLRAEQIPCCEGIYVVCPGCGHKTYVPDNRQDYEIEQWEPENIECRCGTFIEETAFNQWEYYGPEADNDDNL